MKFRQAKDSATLKLAEAYRMTDEAKMADKISDIMDICNATANTHLLWFR